MKIEKKDLPQGQIELQVTLPLDEFKKYFPPAAQELSREVKIEGFRPGKAPLEIVRQKIGEMPILEKAAPLAIEDTLNKAVEGIEFIGQPEINILKLAPGNDLEYKIILTLMPRVDLGKYKGLKVKKEKIEVKEEEIQKQLEFLKEIEDKSKEKKKESKENKAKLIDDDFTKRLGFENLEKLKESLKKSLQKRKEEAAEEKLETEILEKIVKQSKFSPLPPLLINQEIEAMMANLEKRVASQGGKFEEVLKKMKKTKEGLRKEFMPLAEKRIRTALIIREIIKREGIKVSKKEIEARKKQLLKQYQNYPKVIEQIEKPAYQEHLKEILIHQKLMSQLKKWNLKCNFL